MTLLLSRGNTTKNHKFVAEHNSGHAFAMKVLLQLVLVAMWATNAVGQSAPNAAAGSPLAIISDPITTTVDAFYLGSDRHVHQLWLSSGIWHPLDLTAAAGAPNAVAGSPLVSISDPITTTVDVFYLGSDQHVHQLWLSSGIWHPLDLTAAALGAPNAAAGSPLTSISDPITTTVDVFYVGSDQDVHQLWLSSGVWHPLDLTAAAGDPSAFAGSLSSISDPITTTVDAFYLGSDRHVHQLWLSSGIWHPLDLTAAASAPIAGFGSPLVSISDPITTTVDVFYLGSDQHVYELWLSGGIWHPLDVTTAASGH